MSFKKMNRRETFRTLCRTMALGCLGWIGFAASRPPDFNDNDKACQTTSICYTCRTLNACQLPQALTARQERKEHHHDET